MGFPISWELATANVSCVTSSFVQDDLGVDVGRSDGRPLRARYLVGCDGGRSLIRKGAGIHALHLMEDGKTVRLVVTEPRIGPSSEPTLGDPE